MFVIEDETHCEPGSEFASRDAAVSELRRLAELPWDVPPNLAPCMSWRTCGRSYELVEYDDAREPWREIRRTAALEISAEGVRWLL